MHLVCLLRNSKKLSTITLRRKTELGFRRRGREVLLYESDTLAIHEIDPSGQLLQVGTIWRQSDLEQWLNRHYHCLEWVNPEY